MPVGNRRGLVNNWPAFMALTGSIALAANLVFYFQQDYSRGKYKTASSSYLEGRCERKKQGNQPLEWYDAIKSVSTPQDAQKYLDSSFSYDEDKRTRKTGGTFKNTFKSGKGICFDYATMAAALLADDGYPPLILRLDGKTESHAVYLYKDNGSKKFGALGNSPRDPNYGCIKDIALSFGESFDKFAVIDLDSSFPDREWIWGDIELARKRVLDWEQIDHQAKNQN